MSNLLSQLTKSEQARLLEEMNYMKRRSAHVRGVRSSVDDNQGRAAATADARVRLPDRPPAPARRRRLEGRAQGKGDVRAEDAGANRSRAGL